MLDELAEDSFTADELQTKVGLSAERQQMMVRERLPKRAAQAIKAGKLSLGDITYIKSLLNKDFKVTPKKMYALGIEALMLAKRTEARIDKIYDVLLLNVPLLPCDAESITSLMEDIEETKKQRVLTSEDLIYWSKQLLGIDESVLDQIALQQEGEVRPWSYIFSFIRFLTREAALDTIANDFLLEDARRGLLYAVRCFRNTAYTYAAGKHGVKEAKKMFVDRDGDIIRAAMTK